MNQTIDQVLTAAPQLPAEDRMELVEALIDSFQTPSRPPFDDSWRDVVQRRSAELASGRVIGVPWSEVKRPAREKGVLSNAREQIDVEVNASREEWDQPESSR